MKKEVAFAVFIGLILGLIVTFGIYTARTSTQPPVAESAKLLASTGPESTTATSSSTVIGTGALSLSSPEDGLITTAKEVQVSGTTEENSVVFIFYGDEYSIETADATGNFSTRIPTKAGSMVILVRSIDQNGNQVEDQRALFIGDPDRKATPTASTSPAPGAKPSE